MRGRPFLQLAPTKCRSVINAMKTVKNPHAMCERLYNLVHDLTGQLKELISQKVYDQRGELQDLVRYSSMGNAHKLCCGFNFYFPFVFVIH